MHALALQKYVFYAALYKLFTKIFFLNMKKVVDLIFSNLPKCQKICILETACYCTVIDIKEDIMYSTRGNNSTLYSKHIMHYSRVKLFINNIDLCQLEGAQVLKNVQSSVRF